jgi:hypothetical protein
MDWAKSIQKTRHTLSFQEKLIRLSYTNHGAPSGASITSRRDVELIEFMHLFLNYVMVVIHTPRDYKQQQISTGRRKWKL